MGSGARFLRQHPLHLKLVVLRCNRAPACGMLEFTMESDMARAAHETTPTWTQHATTVLMGGGGSGARLHPHPFVARFACCTPVYSGGLASLSTPRRSSAHSSPCMHVATLYTLGEPPSGWKYADSCGGMSSLYILSVPRPLLRMKVEMEAWHDATNHYPFASLTMHAGTPFVP